MRIQHQILPVGYKNRRYIKHCHIPLQYNKIKMFKLDYTYLCFFALGMMMSCTHETMVPTISPSTTTVEYQMTCTACPSESICAVVDDIDVSASTTFEVCQTSPQEKGSLTLIGQCVIWSPIQSNKDVINTCIIACNGGRCDTTKVIIYPAIPVDNMEGNPCDPNVIYFDRDVQPILLNNCAFSGCHNAASAVDGVVLDSYAKVLTTGKVKANNAAESKLYKVITDPDAKDVMPPPPALRLTGAQINIIKKWIDNGAKDEKCEENSSNCDINSISFASFVRPSLAACITCHRVGNAGGGVSLDTYFGVKEVAENGRLYGAIAWQGGFVNMPLGGSKLEDCKIKKIKSWIDAGAANN